MVCIIGAAVGTPAIRFGGRKDVVAVVGPHSLIDRTGNIME